MKKGLTILLLLVGVTTNSIAQNGHLTRHYIKLKRTGISVRMLNTTDAQTVWGLAYEDYDDTAAAHQDIEVEVVKSTDGGRLWATNSIPGTSLTDSGAVSNFWPVDSNTAYLALYNAKTSLGGKILKTGDGGISWQNLTLPTGAFVGGFLDFVYFFSPDSGLAVGDPNGGSFEIYTTSNAGQTWERTSPLNIPVPIAGETGFTNSFTFTKDTFYFATQIGANRLFRSADRGRTWAVGTGGSTLSQVTSEGQWVDVSIPGYPYTFDGKTYTVGGQLLPGNKLYSVLNSASRNYYYFPDTTGNVSYNGIFKAAQDNTLLTVEAFYSNDSLVTIDSLKLYMCNGALGPPYNWQAVVTSPESNLYLSFDGFANYFSNEDVGWLMGITFPDTTQIIYRYQNCAMNPPISPDLNAPPYKVCKGSSVLNLNHYDYFSPPGGITYVDHYIDSLIPPSPLPYYPFVLIDYDYQDPSGCESLQRYTILVDTSLNAPAVSAGLPAMYCSTAPSAVLGGLSPSGGLYYGNAVMGDTFYPAQASLGANYVIYRVLDTATYCTNASEFEIAVENCSGIPSLTAGVSLSLSPNPTSGTITVESASPILAIQVVDVLGEILMDKQNINAITYQMSINELSNGTYMMSVETVDGKTLKRLVKM